MEKNLKILLISEGFLLVAMGIMILGFYKSNIILQAIGVLISFLTLSISGFLS